MTKKFTLSLVALLLLTLNFSFLTAQAQSFEEIQKILADDGVAGDYFGYSVCISGDFAIIGASRDGDNGDKAGSAYIFKKISGSWIKQSKLVASDGSANDHFGFSVSISGDFAIVGAYGDDDNGDASGSSYIFFNNLGIWEEQAKLTATDGTENDWFGQSVSISGNYAIIGAWGNNDNGSFSGAAYIFYKNSGNWEQQIKLLPSDAISSHYFGQSVSISGDFAIAGASGDDDLGVRTGAAYVYNNNSGLWIFHSKLYATEFSEESYFGHPVCINGSKVIIGAQGEGGYSGATYIFNYNLGIWEQESRLTAIDGASMDFFGYSVGITDNVAIVGTPFDDDNGSNSGSSYVFSNISGSWVLLDKLVSSDGLSNDEFGKSVSISSENILIGAYGDDDNGSNSGSAYIFGPSQSQSDSLSLTAFLEGPYNGTDMNTNLNPEPIPLTQPYNDPLKWDYQGTESVTNIPNGDVVDWVLVELRETTGDALTALPDSMITQQAAFILKDGSIVGLDGTSPLFFDNEITNNLYVVVYHRNHLPVMSSGPLTATKGDYTWDFTTPAGQAYGTDAQTDLGGVYGMIGGDGNSNGQIEYYDKDSVWTAEAGNVDYLFGDYTLNQEADNIDKNEIWEPNVNKKNQVPGMLCSPQPDTADAGPDLPYECSWGATMAANTPTIGIGSWSIVNGGSGWFDDVNDPSTNFSGNSGQTYTLKWTISTQCASSYDLMSVYFEPDPTQADAGPDQLNIPDTMTTLQANTPIVGYGSWSIISGEGGSFDDEFDPITTFTGIAGNTYELRWEIFMACMMTEDFVTISFAAPFICGDILTDTRDGQTYNTVQIGTQCWMAENLNIGTVISGNYDQIDNDTIEKYCYDNNTSNCDTYGGLYQWDEMMDYTTIEGAQGICPSGWHVSTDDEWCTLENEVDVGTVSCSRYGWGGTDAGGNLKETGTSHWASPNIGATDSSGFTGLPGGYRRNSGNEFQRLVSYAFFWSSSTFGYTMVWHRTLHFNTSQVRRGSDYDKNYGFSVRCLMNELLINQPPSQPFNPSPQTGSTNISIDTILSWSCSDPDGDDLAYNIYFGTETNPPLIQVNHVDTFYYPGTLLNDTTYYWKIVAYDTPGDSTVGDVWSFSTIEQASWSCGDPLIDDRDGQSYNTVQIGTQCWMAENLNIGMMINGNSYQTNNSIIEKYCYDNNLSNCNIYGGLYQWNEMMQYVTTEGTQGICPIGWHIPTDEEWKQLEGEVDSQYNFPDPEWDNTGYRGYDIGTNLKSSSGWVSNGNGTDIFGFSCLPSGYRRTNGSFSFISNNAYFWTSNNYNFSYGWIRHLSSYYTKTDRSPSYAISYGLSVRCIKNE